MSLSAGSTAVNASTVLYSAGALTIANPSTSCGALWANSTATFTGNAAITAGVTYVGSTLSSSGATSTVTQQFGSLYIAGTGTSSVQDTVALVASGYLYCAGPLTLGDTTNPYTTVMTATTGLMYTKGNLLFSGNTTVHALGLVVNDGNTNDGMDTNFTISNATTQLVDQLGSIWVEGTANWSGTASVQTTNYTDATAKPGTMYITILKRSGTFNDVYGDTWLVGDAGTSDVAWSVTGPTSGTACTIMCPLLATTEKTEFYGKVNFGNMTNPMVYYMMCDNDALYSNTMLLGDDGYKHNDDGSLSNDHTAVAYLGTFYGLIVNMEADMRIYTTTGNTTPCVVGAVFNGTEYINGTTESQYGVELDGAASVAYCQAIIDAVTDTAITTTTQVTQIVPGSWQQLPTHD